MIIGYASSPGTARANRRLSEARAAAVARYFTAHHVDPGALTVVGQGATGFVGRYRRRPTAGWSCWSPLRSASELGRPFRPGYCGPDSVTGPTGAAGPDGREGLATTARCWPPAVHLDVAWLRQHAQRAAGHVCSRPGQVHGNRPR